MQFIPHGPDIPDELIQAHEEGRVVFFCGAGISYPAGLPDFKGLVEQIYNLNGTVLSEIEREAFVRKQFDATLDLLERRLPGGRLAVRDALAQVLKPKRIRKGATDTHAALLRLGRNRQDALRLVTTNFDRVFHAAARRTKQPFQEFAAPMLPIPKNSRWDGLVYLHGLLPKFPNVTDLNRLIVTSGDFGLAYLTERWAARFVSELFRNYIVCFVGYSINDPVLRYMMDALAADRMLGEVTPQAWALGDFEPGNEHTKRIEWEAKGVTPILYEVPAGSDDRPALHNTLQAWADTYRDGVQGKEAIVVKYARTLPQNSTQQDDFVGRMLWALSDRSGLPAKRFAHFNPVPSLDWLLEAFTDDRFCHSDLSRFGVQPLEEVNAKLRFSLVRRPTPYNHAPPMLLAAGGTSASEWDDVMRHLARWLTRHLNDPRLILWVAQWGGQLHNRWSRLIEHELKRLDSLANNGKIAELVAIREHAPNAIPTSTMRTLWRLLLSGRVKSHSRALGFYHWKERLKREGLTTAVRLDLRDLLAPQVALHESYQWDNQNVSSDERTPLQQEVGWDLVLATDHATSDLANLTDEKWTAAWNDALPYLLEDFQQLLRDALDLWRELDGTDERNDRSHWHLPSIAPHRQNRGHHDWVNLIELLRDSWLALRKRDSARATRVAQAWFELPYPTFKRLALFAASHDDCILPELWVDWLLADGKWWLWSSVTGREVFRLLVLQGRHLPGTALERLEVAILAGPPREMYQDSLERDDWQNLVAHSIWLHLAKLKKSGVTLGTTATARLTELSASHPKWQLSANERDEFSHWMSGTGDPDYEENRDVDIAPKNRKELVRWLQKPPPGDRPFYEDTWRRLCLSHPKVCLLALGDLAMQGIWPTKRWSDALHTWRDRKNFQCFWRYAAPWVLTMPDDELLETVDAVSLWLETVSKSINCHEGILVDLCGRIFELPTNSDTGRSRNGEPIYEPVTDAINHPVGNVTQALINLWFKRNPSDNDQLPADIKPYLTKLCDLKVERFRHGRVLLGSRLIALFRVDRPWTEKLLLPLFDWKNPIEAKAVWEGFLWSPRLYQPLLTAFKMPFLETAKHYNELGNHSRQFATILTYAALGPTEGYHAGEFRTAFEALPQEGLEESAQALYQALESAADQCENYWRNRVQPFWQQVWPKSLDRATPRIAASLAQLAIAARGEFPAALSTVSAWLRPIEHVDIVVEQMHNSGLCRKFPSEALSLLDAIIDNQPWPPRELEKCLDEILQASPQLEQELTYRNLREYIRTHE